MLTGVFMESHLVTCVLFLSLLIHMCPAAPGLPGTQREESADPPSAVLPNPFGSGEEDRRLLQSYIQSSLKDGQGGPEISTWEQEVFFLFGLYDYDRSGFLDGLEMMKLLSDYNSHHTPASHTSELVVSMVDFLLHTQDLNQDGLLTPSELLSPPLIHKQDTKSNSAAHQEEKEVKEEKEELEEQKLENTGTDLENTGAVEQREEEEEEAQEERHPQDEDQPQQEVKIEEDEAIKQTDEHNEQQIPEAPEHEQDQKVPVHQGQPEI